MVIVQVTGGLGNQMFAYATGKALSLRTGTDLYLDTSFYSMSEVSKGPDHQKKCTLDVFEAQPKIISDYQLSLLKRIKIFFKGYLYGLLSKVNVLKIYREKGILSYDPTIKNIKSKILYIEGSFQNEEYFCDFIQEIRNDFRFINIEQDKINFSLGELMSSENSVSIHIRRGDYLQGDFHACDINYYRRAIKKMQQLIADPTLYIFSDDIAWCKNNLIGYDKIIFLDHNKNEDNYKDLYLMSKCKNNIIANSTFSWWGAWLNNNTEKIVISPEEWLPFHGIKSKQMIPSSWQVI